MSQKRQPTGSGRIEALRELLRQGETIIDKQFHSSQDHNQKTRHLMTLTSGVLAIGVVVISVFTDRLVSTDTFTSVLISGVFVALLAASFIFCGFAFRRFMTCYLGEKDWDLELRAGWSAPNLAKAAEEDDTLEKILHSTINGFKAWVKENQESLNHFQDLRRKGLRLLWSGGSVLALTLIYGAVASFV